MMQGLNVWLYLFVWWVSNFLFLISVVNKLLEKQRTWSNMQNWDGGLFSIAINQAGCQI
jgi:hypothetical protein